MTETVKVRLDDAMVNRLPAVCVMTGQKADGYAPIVVPKRLGVAWLLLLGGPPGWLVLGLLWGKIRTRYVIKIPMSETSFDRMHTTEIRRLWCAWLGCVGLLAAFALRWYLPMAMIISLASVISIYVALRAHFLLGWTRPSAIADRSGRVVTLRGVHPDFVDALRSHRARA